MQGYRSANGHVLTAEEYEAAWKALRRYNVYLLTSDEVKAEFRHLERERAVAMGDLRARELGADGASIARNTVAMIDIQMEDMRRHARRLSRAELPREKPDGPPPDFGRARYVDLVGLAETLLGEAAVKTGRGRYRIRCPFHDDASPSLVIYPPGLGWYCYVCGAGGSDAVSFVARLKHTTQIEALRWVEELCDV